MTTTAARLYEITTPGGHVADRFRTAETLDASSDENAIANLVDYTHAHPGQTFTLDYVTPRDDDEIHVPICRAHDGITALLVGADDVAADAMHAGPDVTPTAAELEQPVAVEVA